MASRTILVDDVDGTTLATETIRFGYGGAHYEVDLCAENAASLREAMEPFIAAGRRSKVEKVVPVKRKVAPRKTAAVVELAEAEEAPRVKRKYVRKKALASAK